MTNQEKKAYLSRYRDNEREIRRLREEIERWRSTAYAVGLRLSPTGGGGSGVDRLQVNVEQLVQLQNRLARQYDERVRLREEIEDAIETVPEERLRLLLRYRYIDGWTWERISVELSYDVEGRNVYKLHGKALSLLDLDIVLHS